jgi:hypothetical protein
MLPGEKKYPPHHTESNERAGAPDFGALGMSLTLLISLVLTYPPIPCLDGYTVGEHLLNVSTTASFMTFRLGWDRTERHNHFRLHNIGGNCDASGNGGEKEASRSRCRCRDTAKGCLIGYARSFLTLGVGIFSYMLGLIIWVLENDHGHCIWSGIYPVVTNLYTEQGYIVPIFLSAIIHLSTGKT